MTQPIETAIAEIVNVVGWVDGLNGKVPPQPKETMNYGPFALIYYQNGTSEGGPIGTRRELFNVNVDVLTFRENLPDAMAKIGPFLDTVPAALFAEISGDGQRFNKTISTFDKISIQLLPDVGYAKKQCIGYRFTMQNIKILTS